MTYVPEDDKILWKSEPIEFKPKTTVSVQIKQYKEGTPKVLIVEEGIGFKEKPYTAYLLKRLEVERLDTVIELLQKGKEQLVKILTEHLQ